MKRNMFIGEVWRDKDSGICGFITDFDRIWPAMDDQRMDYPRGLVSLSLDPLSVGYRDRAKMTHGFRCEDLEFVRYPNYLEREHFNYANGWRVAFAAYGDRLIDSISKAQVGDTHVMITPDNDSQEEDLEELTVVAIRTPSHGAGIKLRSFEVTEGVICSDGRLRQQVRIPIPEITYRSKSGKLLFNYHPNPTMKCHVQADEQLLVLRNEDGQPVGVEALSHAKYRSAEKQHYTDSLIMEFPSIVGLEKDGNSNYVQLFYMGNNNPNLVLGNN